MASTESKRSNLSAQPHSLQTSAADSRKTSSHTSKPGKVRPRKNKIKKKQTGYVFRPTSNRGQAAVRRQEGRRFYHFDKVRGKTVDFVEFYTAGEYHCLDVRFQDKTSLTFIIEPGFTVETEHCDWKTGNWRPIDRWPLIRSQSL